MNCTDSKENGAFGSEKNIDELLKAAEEYVKKNLKKSRLEHTFRVVSEGVRLAKIYGADINKVKIAAMLHDMAKNIGLDETNRLVVKYGLPDRYIGKVNLAHGKLAAAIIPEIFGITDRELINAVSYHTTGRYGMSLVEKIVFLADAIEPGRTFSAVHEVRKLADSDLDAACLLMLERTIAYIESKKEYLDSDTLEARNYFINKERSYE